MKLRTRILVFAATTLACLILGIYFFSSQILMRSYRELEHQDAERNVQRASLAFSQLCADLHIKAVDWAEWDDSYRFMADHNQAFIKSNMVASSIVSMQLDIIMYLDLKGRIFYSMPVNRLKNVAPPVPNRILAAIGPQRLRSGKPDPSSGFYGVIDLPESPPMLVTIRPVLTTNATGPARGWLVFGRYFDPGALKSLAERTRLDVSIWELDTPDMPADCSKAVKSLTNPIGVHIRPLDEQSIAGYALLSDVSRRPVLLLRVMLPRSIYRQGVQSVQYLMRLILLASFAFSVVILLTLECFAFSRLTNLTKQVENINGDYSLSRVDLPGCDELTTLANSINQMLSALEQRTKQIEHQAFHDALTGLPNRALFMNRLELAHTRARRGKSSLAIIFVDLDDFKLVNDTHGHDGGDQLLKGIAERFKSCVRQGDTVARLGGDEFAVLIEQANSVEDAAEVADRILGAFSAPFPLSMQEIFASASIGIAFQQEVSEASDALLRHADIAMYEAKANGKSACILFGGEQSLDSYVKSSG